MGRAGGIAVTLAALAALAPNASAQITIDGTLSPARALTGPNFSITADLGRQLGGNLFQSFGQFNLNTGESATFSGPNSVTNIIAGVTGGGASTINGTIVSAIPGANLFLINPAGIMFGAGARLNVTGSFHAAAADYLRFADGAVFSATTPSGSTLTAAAPQAFGFLASNSGALAANGAVLAVPTAAQLSLVAGSGGATIAGTALSAPSGVVQIASVAGAGELAIDPTDTAAALPASLGPVSLTARTSVATSGTPAGAIFIRGGVVTLNDATVASAQQGPGTGGGITISGGTIAISGGSTVLSEVAANETGSAGNVSVLATGDVTFTGSTIASETLGKGAAGGVSVTAGGFTVSGGTVASDTLGLATGSANTVAIATGDLTLTASAQIASNSSTMGSAGGVSIVADQVSIAGGAAISSTAFGIGKAGSITLTVDGALSIDGSAAPGRITGISAQSNPGATGNAGTVTITADDLTVSGAGEITASTFGSGQGGTISVTVGGDISLLTHGVIASATSSSGNAGTVSVSASTLTIEGDASGFETGIVTRTSAVGNAGSIDVEAGAITLAGAAAIESSTSGIGNAGAVTVVAGTISQSGNGASISSGATATASGAAGSVAVTAGSLTMQAGSVISSTNEGTGNGGDVTVSVSGDAVLQGFSALAPTSINAESSGPAALAGNITVSAARLLLGNGAQVTTESASGGGGDIVIHAASLVELQSSAITTSVQGGLGNGGNITIDPPAIVLDDGAIVAQAFGGNGGNIAITASVLIQSPDSLISASSALGISGSIDISAPSTDVTAGMSALSGKLATPPNIARAGCANVIDRIKSSSLEAAGRGGLPPDADSPLEATYFAGTAPPVQPEQADATPRTVARQTVVAAETCR